jgi:hypothetical protein
VFYYFNYTKKNWAGKLSSGQVNFAGCKSKNTLENTAFGFHPYLFSNKRPKCAKSSL